MVKPAGKKRVGVHLIKQFRLSERSACRLASISRAAFRYVLLRILSERVLVPWLSNILVMAI